MYERLLLLPLMIRQFLLLDLPAEIIDGDYKETSPYAEIDELAKLHLAALEHMHRHGWPLGSEHRVPIGQRWVKRSLFRRGYYEIVHGTGFGIGTFGGIHVMRSGAIYGMAERVRFNRALSYWEVGPLDMALQDTFMQHTLAEIFRKILAYEPEPITLDS